MKKFCVVLCVALLLTILGGCSVNITIQDENGSSISVPDNLESFVDNLISTDNTDNIGSTTTENTLSDESTVSNKTYTETTTTAKKSENNKPTTSVTKRIDKTNKPTVTTTTIKNRPPQNSKPSPSATRITTSKAKPNHGTPNVQGAFHTDMAQSVLVSLNKARKEAGLNELKMDNGNMMTAAKIRAKEITVHWAHERPDGAKWDTVFNEEGVKYNARGENLADGYKTADAVFEGWMNSPGHRANMMESRFTHISIACFEVDGHFYWVQLFGANLT